MMGLWSEDEGYDGDDRYLILSGGDNWTGPAISTWFEGESTVEVMNAMEYDASAIGNHEFDFKIDALYDRVDEANFPYLSANIRDKTSGEIPDFAVPYIIKDIDGLLVGIIGLSSTSTPTTTFPDHVEDYNFIDYISALNEIVPTIKADGADLLIVISHLCQSEMSWLASTLINLGISAIGGGHCHEGTVGSVITNSNGEVALLKSESFMVNYAKLDIFYNAVEKKVVDMKPSSHFNKDDNSDQSVENVVSDWRVKADYELSEVIGYTVSEIVRGSNAMNNMVVDSWLYKYPTADIAMTNGGGIRQSIPAGDITKETIIGVLPFQNHIVELQLTGEQVIGCSEYLDILLGGMTTIGGNSLSNGTEIDDNTIYSVLTTDYLYARIDYPFNQYDPNPYYTSLNYHQPTIDWIKSLNTSASDPIDNYLDNVARK